jgi:hypothetical protein
MRGESHARCTVAREFAALPFAALAACSPGPSVSMSFARASFYDAPFPSDDLRRSDGSIDLSGFPNPSGNVGADQALLLISDDARGFALAGAVYFHSSDPIDPTSLPDLNTSVTASASVFLVGVDPAQPDFLQRRPVDVAFLPVTTSLGDTNLLAILPLQGQPLRAAARYAAVVTSQVTTTKGQPLMASSEMQTLIRGGTPSGLSSFVAAEYQDALVKLSSIVDPTMVVGLAVFTTDDPTTAVGVVRADALSSHPLSLGKLVPTKGDEFPGYCVFNSTVQVPVYQTGFTPYALSGGTWSFGPNGEPVFDHSETARLIFTVPRRPTPPNGWPTVVFVRTGGGGDRPLVDRGVASSSTFSEPITPGTGPAMEFARVGFVGVEIDGPLGGLRNPWDLNEDALIFNVLNGGALRDNIRQSAMELSLLAQALPEVDFDASSCAGAQILRVDSRHLALMGHSMGSWIEPLTLAVEPTFGATILSGAGGSYIENLMNKLKPVPVWPFAQMVFEGTTLELLDRHDPALTLVQWALEPSDPQVYDRLVIREKPAGEGPRHALMLQGIVDHYILPSIANATSLALGLDEGGPAYDATNVQEAILGQTPLGSLLPLAGLEAIDLPVSGNVALPGGSRVTAVVVQHPGDGIEDGHEVVFQTEPPKHQYRCFLLEWLSGVPSVPADGSPDCP